MWRALLAILLLLGFATEAGAVEIQKGDQLFFDYLQVGQAPGQGWRIYTDQSGNLNFQDSLGTHGINFQGASLLNTTFPTPTLASPTITGTVPGGASYTAPTITNPTVTGTVSGGADFSTGTVTPTGGSSAQTLANFAGQWVTPQMFGAIADGNSHPLSGYFASAAAAEAVCPSLADFIAVSTTGTTNSSTTVSSLASTVNLLQGGLMTVTDADGDIPANTTVSTVNYPAGSLVLSQAATGSHSGDTLTFNITWQNVERDWCAIDAMLNKIRANPGTTAGAYIYRAYFPGLSYVSNLPINLTCFSDAPANGHSCASTRDELRVEGGSASIICDTANNPCYYGLASRYVNLRNLRTLGSCTAASTPSYGLVFGRTNNNISADVWHTTNLRFTGCYLSGSVLNENSEDYTDVNSIFQNNQASGTSYEYILDGGNHWGAPSLFGIAEALTTDQDQSFNESMFLGSEFLTTGTASGIWIYGTKGAVFKNNYVQSNGTACYTLYNSGLGSVNSMATQIDLSSHCEGSATDALLFTGGTSGAHLTSSTLTSLRFNDFNLNQGTIYALDSFVNTGVINGQIEMDVPNIATGVALFDTPANWTFQNPRNVNLNSSITGWAPSVSATGLGTGGTASTLGGTPTDGVIRLSSGTSGTAANGTVTLTFGFALGVNRAWCNLSLQNSTGAWSGSPAAALVQNATTKTAPIFFWFNGGAALTASENYQIVYRCSGN